jgi:hypothetical protein
MRPALLSDLRRVTFGDCPGAGRVHDHCALAGNEPLVIIGVVPSCYVRGQERDQLLIEFERLPNRVGLDRNVALGVDQLSAKRLENRAGGIDRVGCLT